MRMTRMQAKIMIAVWFIAVVVSAVMHNWLFLVWNTNLLLLSISYLDTVSELDRLKGTKDEEL